MYQQLWGYKVEEKLYLGVREQKRLNTTALEVSVFAIFPGYADSNPAEGDGFLGAIKINNKPSLGAE
jgi:hypothetical protein